MSDASAAPFPLVSLVGDDDIVEMVYSVDTGTTSFAIATGENVRIESEWTNDGTRHAPIKGTNNLLRHSALMFPSAPGSYDNTESLISDIVEHVSRYVSLSEESLALVASYILLTWVYDAFNELPYLRFRGDYETGKTRALIVVGSLSYKAFFASGASTVSPIFHTLDTFKGTLIFDEADFRFTDEKAELVKILNNGNAKGFPVLRTHVTPTKEFDPRAFEIFGPKIVGMRRSYEDRALESRFLTVEMQPCDTGAVPINLPDQQKEDALNLRNKLLSYRFRNRRSITLDTSLADPRLEPRMNQILLPLLSVMPLAKMRAAIAAHASGMQARIVSDREASPEGQIIAVLVGMMDALGSSKVPLSGTVAAFRAQHGEEYRRVITSRWVGSLLRRLGIVLYKSNGVFVVASDQEARIERLAKRYGVWPGENTHTGEQGS